jgi:chromosome segregation ATPase
VVGAGALVLSGLTAFAGDGPLVELERGLRDLETTVRAIHESRLEAARETERGRTTAARLEADARDLEREASALEDELGPSRASVASAERDRDALITRKTRLDADRAALGKLLAGDGSGKTSPGVTLAERVKGLEADLEHARACSVESDGSVRLGAAARFAADAPVAHELSEQIARHAHPALVHAPLELGEGR